MPDFVQRLTQRERLLLGGLGGLLVLMLLVFAVVRPIVSFEGEAKARYAQSLRLEALANDIEPPDARPGDEQGLRSVVTAYAERNAVNYTRVTQTADGQVRIDLGDTPHGAVFKWLLSMQEVEGVAVSSASLFPGEASGTVTGQFTLRRLVR